MNSVDKLIDITKIMKSNPIGRAVKLAFEYVEKAIDVGFVFIDERYGYEKGDVDERFENNKLFICADSSELSGRISLDYERRGAKAGLQYAIFENGIYRGYIGADDTEKIRPEWTEDSEDVRFFGLAAEIISTYLFSERNRIKLDEMTSEWNTYRNALMVNSEYVYFADLTDNVIRRPPIYKNPAKTPGKVNTAYPVRLDTYLKLWETGNSISPVDPEFDLTSVNSEGLLHHYEVGEKIIEFEYAIGESQDFRRKSILLDKNSDGHIIATIIVSDIDEIRRAKLRLKMGERQRQNLYGALANLYSCMYKYNLNTGEGTLMKASQDVVQVMPEKVLAKDTEEFFLDDTIGGRENEEFKEFCDFSTIKERLKDKDFVSVEANTRLLGWVLHFIIAFNRDEKGDVNEVLWVTRIIEGRKKHELEMNRRMEEALENAQKANEAKTHFLSSMSHDIRTPMNGIVGMTELAKNNIDNKEKVQDCLSKISISSNHLLTLINDILELSRIESGKITIANEVVDLTEIAGACLAVVESSSIGRRLKMEVNYQPIINRYVKTDGLRMRQCIINVISNAMKYTPDGGSVTISFENYVIDDKHTLIRTYVKDTGIGMSEEFMQKMFQPFAQANESSARTHYEGTGLGMTIVKETMDLFGGSVKVESKLGEGTTVILDFPCENAAEGYQDNKDLGSGEAEDRAVPERLDGLCVLIAEDNDINREVASELLTELGAKVIPAVDGNDAVSKFCEAEVNSVDCILMDIMMPSMDGYTATAVIRSLQREDAKKVPILALSANAFAEDIQKSKDAGMNGHLSKPIEIDKVKAAIIEFAGKRA